MSIITSAEIKGILGIAENDFSKDIIIEKQLPLVEKFLFNDLNNYFESEKVVIETDQISFENPSRIVDPMGIFFNSKFKNGLPIRIKGSDLNQGTFIIKEIFEDKVDLNEDANLIDEDFPEVIISLIKLPDEFKLCAAKLTEFYFPNNVNTMGVESERFDDYSVKYVIKEEIPHSILDLVERHRRLLWD